MRALFLAVFLSPLVGAQVPIEPDRVPVLAELFTSEGCNSCPPADQLVELLGKEQPLRGVYVVAMSEHVTYWDHQGWKDPFGNLRYTNRQNMYGLKLDVPSVFTPQVVIDGVSQVVGSDKPALERGLIEAARSPKPVLTVAIALTDKGVTGSASGPGLEAGAADGAELLWAVTEDNLAVDVKRGENAKRTLRHSGVVRALVARKIEPGQAVTSPIIPLKPDWNREHLRLIAFVQSTKTKRVLSIGWVRVPSTS